MSTRTGAPFAYAVLVRNVLAVVSQKGHLNMVLQTSDISYV